MRMWMIDPRKMCREHLLGEHLECHMFLGAIKNGTSMEGYLKKGLLETHNIQKRHDELVEEMISRGWKHKTLLECYFPESGSINIEQNEKELKGRCSDCRERMEMETNNDFWNSKVICQKCKKVSIIIPSGGKNLKDVRELAKSYEFEEYEPGKFFCSECRERKEDEKKSSSGGSTPG